MRGGELIDVKPTTEQMHNIRGDPMPHRTLAISVLLRELKDTYYRYVLTINCFVYHFVDYALF